MQDQNQDCNADCGAIERYAVIQDANYAHLKDEVSTIKSGMQELKLDFGTLSADMKERTRVPWQVLISAVAFVASLAMAFGGYAIHNINTRYDDLFMLTREIKTDFKSLIATETKDRADSDSRFVTKSEMELHDKFERLMLEEIQSKMRILWDRSMSNGNFGNPKQ